VLTDTSQLIAASRVKLSLPQLAMNNVTAPCVYNCNAPWMMQVGQQVIVAFEAGSVDHPIVLGAIDG
jgi:hypothetical protein